MFRSMDASFNVKTFLVFYLICSAAGNQSSGDLFSELFRAVSKALSASGVSGEKLTRQHQAGQESNGISLSVYNALQSIIQNDDFECVPRLLCEAAAGGNPGAGRQINVDKYSLSKLLSYLQLNPSGSSPMLVLSKALVLGFSNRGDPYSCIVGYPRCPKDQSRLLYYLNNHRGGFFRFFDMKLPIQNNGYGQNNRYPVNYKPSNSYYYRVPDAGLFRGKEKWTNHRVYAKKYGHISFPLSKASPVPGGSEKRFKFPSVESSAEARIQTKVAPPGNLPFSSTSGHPFVFSDGQRYGKTITNPNFFPHSLNSVTKAPAYTTDRLPSRFHFPVDGDRYQMKFPGHFISKGLLFPTD